MFPHTNIDLRESGIEAQMRTLIALSLPSEVSRVKRAVERFNVRNRGKAQRLRLDLTLRFEYIIDGTQP
jgi:hypothetical protein